MSTSSESCSVPCYDIDLLLKSTPQSHVRCFSSSRKYSILTNHFKPPSNFKFSSKFMDGCQMCCQYTYLVDNPYSKEEDGLFCLPCVLFASKEKLDQLVTEKFNHWTKKTPKFSYNSKQYHKLAVTQAEALKSSHNRPELAIDNQLKDIREDEIAKNRTIIKHIASAIHLCGTQSIVLRGHRDKDDSTSDSDNKGNFLAILNYSIKCGNTMLAHHFKDASKNAVYTSETIQNQIIGIIGNHIRDKILSEIKEAKYYSILCDEVSDVSKCEV